MPFDTNFASLLRDTRVGEVVNVHEGPRPILVRSLQTGLIDFFAFPDLRRAECLESEEAILSLENCQETFIAWLRKTFARHCVTLEEYASLARMLGDDYDVRKGMLCGGGSPVPTHDSTCAGQGDRRLNTESASSSSISSSTALRAAPRATAGSSSRKSVIGAKAAASAHVLDQTTSEFERFCMDETINEINRIRVRFGWPRKEQKPRPPDGVPTIEVQRPENDAELRSYFIDESVPVGRSRQGYVNFQPSTAGA